MIDRLVYNCITAIYDMRSHVLHCNVSYRYIVIVISTSTVVVSCFLRVSASRVAIDICVIYMHI